MEERGSIVDVVANKEPIDSALPSLASTVVVDDAAAELSKGRQKNQSSNPSPSASKNRHSTASKKQQKPTVDRILALAHQLSSKELTDLIDGLIQLREARNKQLDNSEWEDRDDYDAKQSCNRRGRNARIEAKLINGCGPYDYLRWWSEGRYKSTYLGKSRT